MVQRLAVLACLFCFTGIHAEGVSALFGLDVWNSRSDDPEAVCAARSPNPSDVTSFYEDNPTYTAANSDPYPWQTGTPESQGMNSSTFEAGSTYLNNLPQAFSLLVLRNDVLVFERYFHGSSVIDSNNVHSSSKSILGALIGIAIDQGYIKSIDQKVSELLPTFSIGSDRVNLTVKDLLEMTSGFKWTEDSTENRVEKKSNWVQAILSLPLGSDVGTTWNYCTGNTHILSAILTEASGMGTCEFAQTYLFDKLGITFEHWGRDPQGYYSGGYNLYIRPRELLKFGRLYLRGGDWNGTRVVSSDWVADSIDAKLFAHDQYHYGYLWYQFPSGRDTVHKMWGYGGQYVYLVPSQNLVVVITSDTKQDFTEMDGDGFVTKYVLGAIQ